MKNTQKGFIVPLLIAIIAVLVIGAGVYVYEQYKPAQQPEQQPIANTQATTTGNPVQKNTTIPVVVSGSETKNTTSSSIVFTYPLKGTTLLAGKSSSIKWTSGVPGDIAVIQLFYVG